MLYEIVSRMRAIDLHDPLLTAETSGSRNTFRRGGTAGTHWRTVRLSAKEHQMGSDRQIRIRRVPRQQNKKKETQARPDNPIASAKKRA